MRLSRQHGSRDHHGVGFRLRQPHIDLCTVERSPGRRIEREVRDASALKIPADDGQFTSGTCDRAREPRVSAERSPRIGHIDRGRAGLPHDVQQLPHRRVEKGNGAAECGCGGLVEVHTSRERRSQGKTRNLLIGVELPGSISQSERGIPGKRELAG